MTSAVLDDIGSLGCVAIMVPMVVSPNPPDANMVMLTFCKGCGFFAVVFLLQAVVFPHDIDVGFMTKVPFFKK